VSSLIVPFAKRPDWYVIPREWLIDVAPIPGVKLLGNGGGVHRTHLPILAQMHPEVHSFIATSAANGAARKALDVLTEPLGFALRGYQHEAREFIQDRRGTLLGDQMRLGKGQPLDAKILTPTGWQRMGDLLVGSRIVDPDGGEGIVEDVFPRGRQPVYRVTTCDGQSTECDEDHLWLLYAVTQWSGMQPSIQPLKDFKDTLCGDQRFFLPLYTAASSTNQDLPLVGLERIDYVGEKETRCICVSTQRGLYVTDGYIVTHNTATSVMSHEPALGPLVVVAPLATRSVWLEWMKRRWPDVEPLVIKGHKYDPALIRDAPCIFIHYDILIAHQNMGLRKPGTLVFDEAHLLQNPKSKRSQAAILLASRAERVIAATGTPLWNRPRGLWTLLSVINPGAWGTTFSFFDRYCDPQLTAYGTRFDGASNIPEFKARVAEIMIRREWRDVAPELPSSERTVEIADVTESQMFRLEIAIEKLRDPTKRRVAAGDVVRFRRLLGQYKAKLAIDVATRVLDSNEPVVVWAWHRDVAEKIAAGIATKGHIAYCLSGADNQDARDRTITEWRRHPIAALVLTIPIGQVGIDLSHARQAVFAEVDWTPATVAQAEMRTFSPLRPMSITYLVVDHDIDRSLVDALQTKCEIATTIGVPASDTAIDMIASAFGMAADSADMNRLMGAFLSGYEEGCDYS
jgi:hypothetical protein